MNSLGEKLLAYYFSLSAPFNLPESVEVLFPFDDPRTRETMSSFFSRFYSDNKSRTLILGINPGRFGAGTTGINFTAPRQLRQYCQVDSLFKDQSELSAEFIYDMIMVYGGAEKFYNDFFIGAVSPLGYIQDGVNMNYYDNKNLLARLEPFILKSITDLLQIGFKTDTCFCIGEDKNFKFLSRINQQKGFFKKLIPLPHPRFIMQYRRKLKEQYIDQYITAFLSV